MSVLDMTSRIGRRARAVKHVMDTYKSVILRPRFKVEEGKTEWHESEYPSTTFIFKVNETAFILTCRTSNSTVNVFCCCHGTISAPRNSDVHGHYNGRLSIYHPFRFKDIFPYDEFGKLKQKALILMKKIAAKPVYDTMLE